MTSTKKKEGGRSREHKILSNLLMVVHGFRERRCSFRDMKDFLDLCSC